MDPRPLLLLCLLLAIPGCRGEAGSDRISRERFVAANVALRTLPPDATEEQRDSVLARYRVSREDLHAWVRAHGERPKVLAEAWQQVAGRLDSLAAGVDDPTLGEVLDAPPPPGEIAEEPPEGVIKDLPPGLPDLPDLRGSPREPELHPGERREPPRRPAERVRREMVEIQ